MRTPAVAAAPTRAAPAPPPAPLGPDARFRTRALAVIATVLTVAALRLSEPVTLPLVLAVFLIAFTWPLYEWVERRTRSWVALLASTLVVVLAAAILAGAVALSVAQITERGPELVRRATALGQQLRAWLAGHGLLTPRGGGGEGARRPCARPPRLHTGCGATCRRSRSQVSSRGPRPGCSRGRWDSRGRSRGPWSPSCSTTSRPSGRCSR